MMGKQTMNFATGLKRARKKAGYKTQEIFSDAIHRSIDTVRNWEQGKNKPSLDDFLSLCDFFGCDADYLLDNLEVQTHDLEFVCEFTGLSAEAVEKLHSVAHLRGHESGILENFDGFIVHFYGLFLHKLWYLKVIAADSEACIEGAEKYGSNGIAYSEMREQLFLFQEFCKRIPEELFHWQKIYEKLGATKRLNPSDNEASTIEFLKNGGMD